MPKAKLRASLRVMRTTSAYASSRVTDGSAPRAARRANVRRDGEGRPVNTSYLARARASRAARPPRAKSPTERPARPPSASASPNPRSRSGRARAALEREQRGHALAPGPGEIGVGDREPAQVLLGQIHPSERQVARRILEEVHELQAGAHVVAARHELGIAGAAVDAEHEPADGIGGVRAVVADVGPGLVPGRALVDPVRLDQARERLPRKLARGDRRVEAAHDRRARRPVQLALELVEQRGAITGASSPIVSTNRANPYSARRCGRALRGARSDTTGKFSPRARASIRSSASSGAARRLVAGMAPHSMERRSLGKTGVEVPVVGLGTWLTFDVGPTASSSPTMSSRPPTETGRASSTPHRCTAARRRCSARRSAAGATTSSSHRRSGRPRRSRDAFSSKRSSLLAGREDFEQVHNLVAWEQHLAWLEHERDRTAFASSARRTTRARRSRTRAGDGSGRIDAIQIPYSPRSATSSGESFRSRRSSGWASSSCGPSRSAACSPVRGSSASSASASPPGRRRS